ncbi:hypothetical protein PINS_up012480 [Pythium insidiosum]|nr:hypothetical protein PINS_up012480 [Pythium insidiosum]
MDLGRPRDLGYLAAFGMLYAVISEQDWRRVAPLADERVSPTAVFKGLRVGCTSTCVTLHQVVNETGRWRTLETCIDLRLGEYYNQLSLRDAQTGQRLTVVPICKANRDSLAEKMGIPSRVDIASVWDKQCASCSSAVAWLEVFGLMAIGLAVCASIYSIFCESESWAWKALFIGLPAIPVATQLGATYVGQLRRRRSVL